MNTHPFNPQPDAAPAPEPEAVDIGLDMTTEPEPAEEPAPEPENIGAKIAKRPPTNLESDILTVCRSFKYGNIKLPEGKLLTPHAIAKFVEANRGDGKPVSTGAVSDCLKRWDTLGFVNLSEKPIAFDTFVGGDDHATLRTLKNQRKAELAAKRTAERAAKAAAEKAAKEQEASEEPIAVTAEAAVDPVADSDTAPAPGF